MAVRYRSLREEISELRSRLRAEGWTYTQIAHRLAETRGLGVLVAFRLAHGLTQEEVAARCNAVRAGSSEVILTGQNICYWEAWPRRTGRQPSLSDLGTLARVYRCGVRDLVQAEDFSGLDPMAATSPAPMRPEVFSGGAMPGRMEGTSVRPMGPGGEINFLLECVEGMATAHGTQRLSPEDCDRVFNNLLRGLLAWAGSDMRRRELVRILGWAATGAAASPALQSATGDEHERVLRVLGAQERLDGSVLDTMQEVLWLCMRQDDALGPQAALGTVLAQRRLAELLARDCPGHLRSRLLTLWSNLSRTAGWMCFDLGSYRDAEHYYEDARAKAHAAGDVASSAMVLCQLSHLATWTGRPRLGVDHAVAAQEWARRVSDPLLRGYAFDVAARARAKDHQRDACLADLDAAEAEVSAASGDLDPTSLAYFNGPAFLTGTRSFCQLDLGEPEGAAAAATAALAGIDPSFVRNRAMNLVELGKAYVRMGEVDEAVDAGRQASSLLAQNRSVRAVQDFQVLCGELGPWRRTPAVRDLLASAADLGLTSRPA